MGDKDIWDEPTLCRPDAQPGSELARLQRENAIMRQALRKSQHYLGRYLEPGNLSATECINGLLKTLDNDEINEVTKR